MSTSSMTLADRLAAFLASGIGSLLHKASGALL